MTLDQVGQLRDKYFAELVRLDAAKTTHDVDREIQHHDEHRESINKQFLFYDDLYNRKANAGKTYRLNRKAL